MYMVGSELRDLKALFDPVSVIEPKRAEIDAAQGSRFFYVM